jgi:hypothetical protein
MKSCVVLLFVLMAAQPAVATRFVQLAPAAAPGDCLAGAPSCAAASPVSLNDSEISPGSLVAGVVGLLVLGLVFGRRKSGLPQVVS